MLLETLSKAKAVDGADVHLFWLKKGAMASGELEDFSHFEQKGSDLGERMHNALKQMSELGYQRSILIGSDIWQLSTSILKDALEVLSEKQVVLGPATDGGYYLVGLSEPKEELFTGMKWSQPSVFEETISRLKRLKLLFGLTQELNDIDTIDDLNKDHSLVKVLQELQLES